MLDKAVTEVYKNGPKDTLNDGQGSLLRSPWGKPGVQNGNVRLTLGDRFQKYSKKYRPLLELETQNLHMFQGPNYNIMVENPIHSRAHCIATGNEKLKVDSCSNKNPLSVKVLLV